MPLIMMVFKSEVFKSFSVSPGMAIFYSTPENPLFNSLSMKGTKEKNTALQWGSLVLLINSFSLQTVQNAFG